MSENPQAYFEYILHENGIHEFILKDSNMAGANAYLAEIEPIYSARNPASPPLLVIINSTGEYLPLNYNLLQRVRALLTRYPNIGATYTSIITNDQIATRLANSFIRVLRFPGITVHFFLQSQHDEAVQWLLQQSQRA